MFSKLSAADLLIVCLKELKDLNTNLIYFACTEVNGGVTTVDFTGTQSWPTKNKSSTNINKDNIMFKHYF